MIRFCLQPKRFALEQKIDSWDQRLPVYSKQVIFYYNHCREIRVAANFQNIYSRWDCCRWVHECWTAVKHYHNNIYFFLHKLCLRGRISINKTLFSESSFHKTTLSPQNSFTIVHDLKTNIFWHLHDKTYSIAFFDVENLLSNSPGTHCHLHCKVFNSPRESVRKKNLNWHGCIRNCILISHLRLLTPD